MRNIVLYAVVGAIILIAFSAGLGFAGLNRYTLLTTQTSTTITQTQTTVTYAQISGTNHSVFFITEKVEVEPELINAVCNLQTTITTLTTYYLPTEAINGSNPVGILSTTTVYNNVSTPTYYENAIVISNGTTCTISNGPSGNNGTSTCFCV